MNIKQKTDCKYYEKDYGHKKIIFDSKYCRLQRFKYGRLLCSICAHIKRSPDKQKPGRELAAPDQANSQPTEKKGIES